MCSSYQCLLGGRESCIHGYSYQTNNFGDPLRTVVNGLTKCFTKTVGIFLNKLSRDHYYKKNHETNLWPRICKLPGKYNKPGKIDLKSLSWFPFVSIIHESSNFRPFNCEPLQPGGENLHQIFVNYVYRFWVLIVENGSIPSVNKVFMQFS